MTNILDKQEKETSSLKYAMHYGLILGLFWIVKYSLLMLSVSYGDIFKYLSYVLNVGTFLLIYMFTYKFKESDPAKIKGAFQSILFTVLLCFFASFFEGAIMYAHYKFIDPAYFKTLTEPFMLALDKVEKPQSISVADFDQSKAILRNVFANETVFLIMKFVENTFLGLLLGSFMAVVFGNRRR